MSESTRRGFLILAGAGAAATAGVAAIAANGGGPARADDPAATTPATTRSGPLVAYVEDVRSDRVSVMVGETEVVVSDRDLVARLARAAAGKKA